MSQDDKAGAPAKTTESGDEEDHDLEKEMEAKDGKDKEGDSNTAQGETISCQAVCFLSL